MLYDFLYVTNGISLLSKDDFSFVVNSEEAAGAL